MQKEPDDDTNKNGILEASEIPAGPIKDRLPQFDRNRDNRIDRADYSVGGHCGEFRASFTSTDIALPSFHALFIFRQPAGAGDTGADGRVNCAATARRWAELSRLDGDALRAAVRAEIRGGFTTERFLLAETVELTISPWEWRQWVKV